MENNYQNNEQKTGGAKQFLASAGGRVVMTIVFAVVIWGLFLLLVNSGTQAAGLILIAICGYFGWQALNKITPSIFLIMPIAGWLFYFFVKGALSVLIGIFVAPVVLGKKISDAVSSSLNV